MKYDTAPVMPFVQPQGRLTNLTLTPVQTAATAAAANVFYTPRAGNLIPIWDGVQFKPQIFTELTNVLANSATGNAGPAAGATSKNYDMFVWQSGGVNFLTRGGAWFSDTARSTATENDLQMVNGVLCNLNAITNGPAAGYGTYVGTIRTDAGGATVSWSLGSTAAGGGAATINIWNMYNRVQINTTVIDSTTGGTYSTATVRAAGNSNGNRVSFVRGLNEEGVRCTYQCLLSVAVSVGGVFTIGVTLDATNTLVGHGGSHTNQQVATATTGSPVGQYVGLPGLGFHFLQSVELGDGTNTSTNNGDAKAATIASMSA